jgi:hypothetical protein
MSHSFTGELILLSVLSTLIVSSAAREAYHFFRWKRELGRMDKGEWSRVIRMIRDQ